MHSLISLASILAVASASAPGLVGIDPTEAVVQGPKAVLVGAAATLSADAGAIIKTPTGTAVIAPEAHVIGGPLAAAYGPHSLSAGAAGIRSIITTPYTGLVGARSVVSPYAATAYATGAIAAPYATGAISTHYATGAISTPYASVVSPYSGLVSGAISTPYVGGAIASPYATSYATGLVSGAVGYATPYATHDAYTYDGSSISAYGAYGADIGLGVHGGVY